MNWKLILAIALIAPLSHSADLKFPRRAVAALACAASAADEYTTRVGLAAGAHEANPVASAIGGRFRISIRIATCATLVGVPELPIVRRHVPEKVWLLLAAPAAGESSWAAIHNRRIIAGAGK